MTALDFPATPVVNDKYPQPPVVGQPVYTWDGVKWTTGDTIIQAMGEPSNALPLMDTLPAQVGTSASYSREDHRHPTDASLAPINAPTFTGAPMADTPPMGDNSNRLATTAYVAGAAFVTGSALPSNSTPLPNGSPQPGTSILFARDDHIHPTDPSRAPLNSPVFTGAPEAPTPPPSSNGTQIATTAYVSNAVSVIGGIAPSDAVPLIDSGSGFSGSSTAYARGDHVHPAGPAPTPPAAALPIMDSTAAVGVAAKYAREDHVHPSDTTRATTTYVDTGLAGKANSAHTHIAANVTDFSEAVDDRVGSLLVAGTNVNLDYNDTANTLTITATAGSGSGSGDVTGPAGAVADHIAIYSGATGKIIKDSGSLISAFQPADADLTAIAGLTSAADRLPYFTGSGAAALAIFTGAARNLLDDADAPTMRATLGLTSPATATPSALSKTDDTNVTLTLGGTPSTALLQPASITAGWSGTLSPARGGFGSNIAAQSGVPLFATGVPTFTGTNGSGNFVLTNNPVFTGDPQAPTPLATDNDTSIATTAYVTNGVTSRAVRYDAVQGLTVPQQLQARQNAYAAPLDAFAYNGLQLNGAMAVSQELGSAGVSGITNLSPFILDGWVLGVSGASVLSASQASGYFAAQGLPSYFVTVVATPDAAPAAGSVVLLTQAIEGYRIARLAWGTANAQPITIGFWTGHHRTGTYCVSARTFTGSRSYVTTYTQTVADALEYKTVTIPGDTAGTWLTDNSPAMVIGFTLMSGTTLRAPATNTWYGVNYVSVAAQVNAVAATTDIFRITGVAVLPGNEAPSAARSALIMRPYDQELVMCKRYWEQVSGTYRFNMSVNGYGAVSVGYTVAKRSAPTCTFTSGGTVGNSTFGSFVTNGVDAAGLQFTGTPNADSYNYGFLVNADARI